MSLFFRGVVQKLMTEKLEIEEPFLEKHA